MKARFISPQLATLTEKYFSDKDWIYEDKLDGIRCIGVKSGKKVTLYSRNRKTLNADFPKIVKMLEKASSKDFVIDGELVAFEGKVTSFSKLQQRKLEKMTLYYYVFDLLVFDGKDLRKLPLIERKKALKKHIRLNNPCRYLPHVKKEGLKAYKKASQKGLEGIIAKKATAPYKSQRTTDWLKFKCINQQELVIGGFTDPRRSRTGFGALLVGYYTSKGLHYAGKVGTGYDEALLSSLSKKLKRLERTSCPFITKPKEKGVHFVSPTLVCEVGFTEWTKDNKLRHPRFLGLRQDKPAKKVRKE